MRCTFSDVPSEAAAQTLPPSQRCLSLASDRQHRTAATQHEFMDAVTNQEVGCILIAGPIQFDAEQVFGSKVIQRSSFVFSGVCRDYCNSREQRKLCNTLISVDTIVEQCAALGTLLLKTKDLNKKQACRYLLHERTAQRVYQVVVSSWDKKLALKMTSAVTHKNLSPAADDDTRMFCIITPKGMTSYVSFDFTQCVSDLVHGLLEDSW